MGDHSKLRDEVLAALEAPPELHDHLDELLADLPDLGTDPAAVVELLRPLGLQPGARVLDLGCGSGIVAVALARELGFKVQGIDGYEPFVERARHRAEADGVLDQCTFRVGDLRDALNEGTPHDVVIFGAVGDVLGDLAGTVNRLRAVVSPGGYMIIDHAFAATQDAASPGYPQHAEAIAALTGAGDDLLAEVVLDVVARRAVNERNNRLLAARAAEIGNRVPEVAPVLAAYLEGQREECHRLETTLIPVLWLVRRCERPSSLGARPGTRQSAHQHARVR